MTMTEKELVRCLLGELRYVLSTGDIRDSERNSAEFEEESEQ